MKYLYLECACLFVLRLNTSSYCTAHAVQIHIHTLAFWTTTHRALWGPLTWRPPSRRSLACHVRKSWARRSINSGLALPSGHASLSRGHNSRIRDGPWDAPTPTLLSLVLLTLANSIPRGADRACALWQRQDVRPSGHHLRPCLRMESSWKTVEPGMERNPV